jgi:hypothetical protein
VRYHVKKGRIEYSRNNPLIMAYTSFNGGRFLFKLLLVFLPLLNTVFVIIGLLLIYKQIPFWYYNIGKRLVRRMTRDPDDMRNFGLKLKFVHIFFYKLLDYFFDRYENNILDKTIKNVLKKKADEKSKQECNSKPEPGTGDQKAPEKEVDNSDRSS